MRGEKHQGQVQAPLVQYRCFAKRLPKRVRTAKTRLARRERTRDVEGPLVSFVIGSHEGELYAESGELHVGPDVFELAAFQKDLCEVFGLASFTDGDRRQVRSHGGVPIGGQLNPEGGGEIRRLFEALPLLFDPLLARVT